MSPKNVTGSFVYAENLMENLFKIDLKNQYFLFVKLGDYFYWKRKFREFYNVKFIIIDVRKDIILNPIRAVCKIWTKLNNKENLRALVCDEMQKEIELKKIGTLFSPSQAVYPSGLKNIRLITTICDLQHEYMPNNFSPAQLKLRREDINYAVKNSIHLIAISEYTKKMITETYMIDPNKITVTYLAPNIPKETKFVRLPDQFMFYPAAFWPHKNQEILIESLKQLEKKFPDLHLVLTGMEKKREIRERITRAINRLGLKEKVHILGFVSASELAYIYSKAEILVYPSSFEGFGIPIVEAFNYKVPVIAANNTSINEIVAGAGILFKTGNLQELSQSISRLLGDENLRKKLIQKGQERLQKFSWEECAKKTIQVLTKMQ